MQCVASQVALTITSPASGAVLKAGNSYPLSWSGGGSSAVRIQLRYDSLPATQSGYGIPAGAVCTHFTYLPVAWFFPLLITILPYLISIYHPMITTYFLTAIFLYLGTT
jgi:hypothetical protein